VPSEFSDKLLTPFQTEANRLRAHERYLSDPLKVDRGIVESTQQIFRHVLRNGLGVSVVSFSQDEKQEVLEALGNMSESDADGSEDLEPFVELFAEFCDQWPDVIDISYGGSPSDFREFRAELVPELLDALTHWSQSRGQTKFAITLKSVYEDYKGAVAESSRGLSDDEQKE
jgi:hypothetical protein